MRVSARVGATVGAAALLCATGSGVAAAAAGFVTADVFLNDQKDKATVEAGKAVKVGEVLTLTLPGDHDGRFVTTFDPAVLKYTGGRTVPETSGDCTISRTAVSCPVNVNDLSKRIDLDFVVIATTKAKDTTVHFTGSNGDDAPATATGTLTITPAPPSKPTPPAVYYKDCAAARAAHAAPIKAGQPGYRLPLDRDHDGVACEDPPPAAPASNNNQQVSQVPAGAPDTGGGSTAPEQGFPVWLEIVLGAVAVTGAGLAVRTARTSRHQ